FKKSIRRPIQPLPHRAHPDHLILKLSNSASYLQEVLSSHLHVNSGPHAFAQYQRRMELGDLITATSTFRPFANRYFILSRIEERTEQSCSAAQNTTVDYEKRCTRLAGKIDAYLTAVGDSYDSNPEQKS